MDKKRLSDKEVKIGLTCLPFAGWLVALVFMFSEKEEDVRWFSAQSLVLHAGVFAIYFLVLPLIRMTVVLLPLAWFLQGAVGVGFVLLMLYSMVKSHKNERIIIPVVSEWVEKLLKKSR